MTDTLTIAQAVRDACVGAALDGYEQAQIAGLCQAGAWECAVDAIRALDINSVLQVAETGGPPDPPRGPASA